MSSSRSPEEIRDSIEKGRAELAVSITNLRSEVVKFTDWRGRLEENRDQAVAVAAVAGFVIGGGVLAIFGRRRRR
jgi:uncharacterized membrane protein